MNHVNASAANTALLSMALRLTEENHAYAWATVIRAAPPSSAYVGAQAIVADDGKVFGWVGGGCARDIVVQSCLDAMQNNTSKLIRISNEDAVGDSTTEHHAMPCASNGTLEIFIQPVNPLPLLYIAGTTPAAAAAAQFARMLGWRVVQSETSLADCRPDYVLLATQGDNDLHYLEQALQTQARKVLLIASSRKAESLRASMRHLGISDDRLGDIESPAGPDILAETPAEVALAAMAGLIRAHHEASGRPQTEVLPGSAAEIIPNGSTTNEGEAAQPDVDLGSQPAPAYVNPVCLRVIDPSTALHTINIQGTTHYFCCQGCKTKFDADPGKYLVIARKLQATALP